MRVSGQIMYFIVARVFIAHLRMFHYSLPVLVVIESYGLIFNIPKTRNRRKRAIPELRLRYFLCK